MKRLALVLPVLLVAACGGASGLSKADYVKQAEAICKKANADIEALGTPSDLSQIGTFVDSLVAVADTATSDLVDLDAPEDDAKELKSEFLDPLEKQVQQGKKWATDLKAAAAAKDQAKLGQLIGSNPVTSEPDLTWMKDYGFVECVEAAKTDK